MQEISIHVPREGDDDQALAATEHDGIISIHVPREGDDCVIVLLYDGYIGISIHVPREGDDRQHLRKAH